MNHYWMLDEMNATWIIEAKKKQITLNNASIFSQTKYPVEHESMSILKSCSKGSYSKYKQNMPISSSKIQSLTNDLSYGSNNQQINDKNETINYDNSKWISDINDLDETQLKWLIQPLPWMKSKSNYKTFREGSLPKSINSFKSLAGVKTDKLDSKALSRNRKSVLFPLQTRDWVIPQFSVSSNAYNLTTTAKNNINTSVLLKCKSKNYKK